MLVPDALSNRRESGQPPEPGDVVRVRARRHLVEDVTPPGHAGHQQTLVRLSCIDDDSQGTSLDVLWEREIDATIIQESAWTDLGRRGFDAPNLFSAFLHALRWNLVTSTNPRLFQSPYRAGIEVMAYQLEPLRKALLLPRVNLFIADDVGLGKTIEAGLIIRELLMRQKVKRIVVACPASVLLQWRDELESRFGLTFVVLDREYVLRCRRERGYGVNPWSTHTRFVISHSLLRDETYAGPLRDWLETQGAGSLLILDEAHNAAPASGSRYAIDSHFTKVMRELTQQFEHRLFLSATPHNGHSNSFSALLEMLDPQRFCRGVPVRSQKLLSDVMVRRLKSDLREVAGGFPLRKIVQHDVDGLPDSAPELRLSRLLQQYRKLRETRLAGSSKSQQAAAALVVTSLQKRLLSSTEAFAHTLRVHRKSVETRGLEKEAARDEAAETLLLLEAPSADDDRAELPEEDVVAEMDEAMAIATLRSMSREQVAEALLQQEKNALAEMTEAAEAARGLADPRIKILVKWVEENLCPGWKAWNARRVLIFTEYTDTKRYLEQQLRAAIARVDPENNRIATFHGGMGEATRQEVKQAFNGSPAKFPLRILIATDAGREGVNFQNHCADLFHFDVPWNPSRMEQRNGRIDRKLQRSPEVRCHYFVYQQRPEDRVLQVLVKKTETIQKELGSLSPVLERRLSDLLSSGLSSGLESKIEAMRATDADRQTVEDELEAARERKEQLQEQLDTLRDMLDASQRYLGLDERHFKDSIDSSLSMLGAPPLHELKQEPDQPERYEFPALDRRAGADSTWSHTLDSLRIPRRPDQKVWEWRKESPIRPIVFRDSGTLDDEVVHLHLEHRVVQRLLSRFRSQGFVYHDLSRACVGQTTDTIPRVILIGRLSLYGPNASRLHDEIVPITARWIDPDVRKEPLKPYSEETEAKTLDLLEDAFREAQKRSVPAPSQERLLRSAERDVTELVSHLQDRAAKLADKAAEQLTARGEKEAKELTSIIEAQRTRILATMKNYDDRQQRLEFDGEDQLERRQRETDRKYWDRRLTSIDKEIVSQPAQIKAGYVVKAKRMEPVGLVYLWPISG
ncbi:MAG: DISARM system SNF2-like helicase DrmD [Bryobacteraceae bacterium]